MPPTTLLPAAEPIRAPQRTRRNPERQPSARVLLVEDEPLTAEVFARALAREGFAVDVARDGLQALRRLHDQPPTLVVLDMSLPTLSGAEIVRRLRRDGYTKLPIVVVSGSSRTDARLSVDELTPGRWIDKPVKPRDLVHVVQGFLQGSV